MYYSFNGIVSTKLSDSIGLDVMGVEYQLLVSTRTLQSLKIGDKTRLYSYLQHTENAMMLFGFITLEEKNLFLNLLKVNGIGPKGAMKILSGISVDEFVNALNNGDVSFFTSISGLGKATAQKMVLALKGKLVMSDDDNGLVEDDLAASLKAMGFDKKKVDKVVAKLRKENKDSKEQELIRLALKELS